MHVLTTRLQISEVLEVNFLISFFYQTFFIREQLQLKGGLFNKNKPVAYHLG